MNVTFKLVPIIAPAASACHADFNYWWAQGLKNVFGVQREKHGIFWGGGWFTGHLNSEPFTDTQTITKTP